MRRGRKGGGGRGGEGGRIMLNIYNNTYTQKEGEGGRGDMT